MHVRARPLIVLARETSRHWLNVVSSGKSCSKFPVFSCHRSLVRVLHSSRIDCDRGNSLETLGTLERATLERARRRIPHRVAKTESGSIPVLGSNGIDRKPRDPLFQPPASANLAVALVTGDFRDPWIPPELWAGTSRRQRTDIMQQLGNAPSTRALMLRMLRLAARHWRGCLTLICINGALVCMSVSGLSLTGLGIDFIRHHVQPSAAPPDWPGNWHPPATWSPMQTITCLAAVVLGVGIVAALLKFAATIAGARLSQKILVELRSNVYDRLQRLSFDFFDSNPSSSLINRAAGDVQAVRVFVDGVFVKLIVVALTLAVYLGYMLSVHPLLTCACLATSPLLWLGAVIFSRRVQPEYRQASDLVDDLVLSLVENVQGQHVVKGFAQQSAQIDRFAQANHAIHNQKRGIFWQLSLYQPLMGGLTQANTLVLILYGGYLVVRGDMLLGAGLFVFANLLHEFANQVGQITNIANTIQTSLTGAARVFEILDAPLHIASPENARPLPPQNFLLQSMTNGRAGRKIELRNVSFAYSSSLDLTASQQRFALDQVSFSIQPGECLGIVGETGAGKTTLLNLLLRFYDVSSGQILIDGIDLRQLDLDDLRREIGIVFQEPFLFSNTIGANIAFGYPEASAEQIERAARLAAADEFIEMLPDRYETVVGEYGANLSGGQRQRLSIARALLLDPSILVLDDATSSVDPETEDEIQQSVTRVASGRTTIIVSNRIHTLRHADRIIVLRQGRVVQDGPPNHLFVVPGPFRDLARLQLADSTVDAHREAWAA